jgi:thiol-disulfide isomerase/thioredoxin
MRKIITVLTFVTLTAFACGGSSGDGASSGSAPQPAPELELEVVNGSGTFSFSEQKGKVVLVDLWATWCAPCISELPHLQQLSESYDPNEFAMVGIVLESGDREEIDEFIAKKSIKYTNLFGLEGSKEAFGPFLGYPTKYLIDKDGYVVKKYFGVGGDQLTKDVEKLVRTGSLKSTD